MSTMRSKQTLAPNTWTTGTPMHRRILAPAAAVLGGKIYVEGALLIQLERHYRHSDL